MAANVSGARSGPPAGTSAGRVTDLSIGSSAAGSHIATLPVVAEPAAVDLAVLHGVSGSAAGGMVDVELWVSQGSPNAFVPGRLETALESAGITVQPKTFDVIKEITY